MPKMVEIEPNPSWKPEKGLSASQAAQMKAAYADVEKRGRIEVTSVTAREALRRSHGMYRIATGQPEPKAPGVRFEDMDNKTLLQTYFSVMGAKPTEKQIRRADMIAAMEKQMEGIEVLSDDAE